jgi:hypothetical protein
MNLTKLILHLGSFMAFVVDSGFGLANVALTTYDLNYRFNNKAKFWIVFIQILVSFLSQLVLAHIVYNLGYSTA